MIRPPVNAGLCANCRYRRWIRSDKGSSFVMCLRHREPASRYVKYPRLPVLSCSGYEGGAAGPDGRINKSLDKVN